MSQVVGVLTDPEIGASWVALLFIVLAGGSLAVQAQGAFIEWVDAKGLLPFGGGGMAGRVAGSAAGPGKLVRSLALQPGPWVGLFHPAGLGAALLSGMVAWMLINAPVVGRWADQAGWVLLVGLGSFVACAAVVARFPPGEEALRRIWETRQRIGRLIQQRLRSVEADKRDEVQAAADGARDRIDREVVPAFMQLVQYNLALRNQLRELGQVQRADERDALKRIREEYERQRAETARCIEVAVEQEANLFLLLQRSRDEDLAGRLRGWAGTLDELLARIAEAIEPAPVPNPDVPTLDPLSRSDAPDPDFVADVDWTLKHLHQTSVIGKGRLADRLPHSIRGTCGRWEPPVADPTDAERGRALRELGVAAIDKQRALDRPPNEQPHAYYVLHEAYVMGLPNKVIEQRHGVTRFFAIRKEAVKAVATELWQQERRFVAAENDGVTSTRAAL